MIQKCSRETSRFVSIIGRLNLSKMYKECVFATSLFPSRYKLLLVYLLGQKNIKKVLNKVEWNIERKYSNFYIRWLLIRNLLKIFIFSCLFCKNFFKKTFLGLLISRFGIMQNNLIARETWKKSWIMTLKQDEEAHETIRFKRCIRRIITLTFWTLLFLAICG